MSCSPRTNLLCSSLALALLAIAFAPLAGAYPKPRIYPVKEDEPIKFSHSHLKRIVVTTPGTNTPTAYWYMTYTVTNENDREVEFLPVFQMLTSDGNVIRSDKNIPLEVFDAIKKREHKGSLEPMEKIAGTLRIGEDQSRDGVAIWEEPSKRMRSFDIFVAGLSKETIYLKDGEPFEVKDWTKLTEDERKQLTPLHKTLQISYQIAGDEIRPDQHELIPLGEEWIMR